MTKEIPEYLERERMQEKEKEDFSLEEAKF
jgi:hypothetical protein